MNKKYLLLAQPEEEFPEQFNSHIFLIMEAIELAKRLGRVFVLPDIHSHPRDSALCEAGETDHNRFVVAKINYPFESIFRADVLSDFIDVITFKEFVKASGGQISTLYEFGREYGDSIAIYGAKFRVARTERMKNMYDITDSSEPFIALAGCRRRHHTHDRSPNWQADPTMHYWEIRTSLKHVPGLVRIADEFIARELAEPFVAVHWRRGDRVHAEMGGDRELVIEDRKAMERMLRFYLVRPIRRIMKNHGIRKVFLATNSGTKWHLEYLAQRLPIVQYPSSGKPDDALRESIVEQNICSKSAHYFSSPFHYEKCSSFSRWIIDDKRIVGSTKHVTYQKKMVPLSVLSYYSRTALLSARSLVADLLGSVGLLKAASRARDVLRRMRQAPTSSRAAPVARTPGASIRGDLFDNKFLDITSASLQKSGSWNPYLDNLARAEDHQLIKLVYDRLRDAGDAIMIDVGANMGSFALLPRFLPRLTVHAFEPIPHVYRILEENVRLNGLRERVRTVNMALSDRSGTSALHVPSDGGSTGLATFGNPRRFKRFDSIDVSVTTLDEFVASHGIARLDFIKIDTEGAELSVINGALKTIARFKPAMLVECDAKNTAQFGYGPEKIESALKALGYIMTRADSGNIMCVHPSS